MEKVLSDMGNVIKQQREARGMSSNELANLLNRDEGFVDQLERGEHNVTFLDSRALGVSLRA